MLLVTDQALLQNEAASLDTARAAGQAKAGPLLTTSRNSRVLPRESLAVYMRMPIQAAHLHRCNIHAWLAALCLPATVCP